MQGTTQTRNYIIAVALVFVFALLTLVRLYPAYDGENKILYTDAIHSDSNPTATLSLVFDEKSKRKFSGPVFENTTILDALRASSRAGNFEFAYGRDENGIVINELGGLEPSPDSACNNWCFYINSVPVELSVLGVLTLEDGDVVEVSTYELY